MEFSGYGTIQPIQGVSESDVQHNREIEGGWFISGPAQIEMMEHLRSKTRYSFGTWIVFCFRQKAFQFIQIWYINYQLEHL